MTLEDFVARFDDAVNALERVAADLERLTHSLLVIEAETEGDGS